MDLCLAIWNRAREQARTDNYLDRELFLLDLKGLISLLTSGIYSHDVSVIISPTIGPRMRIHQKKKQGRTFS
jgi:hypothetical protein